MRCALFVARKGWIVAGSDDGFVRVYSYSTGERVTAFEAHSDYVRSLDVHATLPLLLSCSDDQSIKMWDWERGWRGVCTYEGHAHYVMCARFNPKDANSFATASLDCTIKVCAVPR